MLTETENQVLDLIKQNGAISSSGLYQSLGQSMSLATLKRILTKLVDKNLLTTRGQSKSTKYHLSPCFMTLQPLDMNAYFQDEIDEREVLETFNFDLIHQVLNHSSVFTKDELKHLEDLQFTYTEKVSQLTPEHYNKELERLAIDLSWKSSQIEGNTYTLLETERLLKEKETAAGKTPQEASMLLNHKEALDFIIQHPRYLQPLSIAGIEDLHRILIHELGVVRNLRIRRVGISGTRYTPLDNEYQIREALQSTCDLINRKINVFEKALLALALISYIQPFMDGNKRTARMTCNALLISENHCPLSFRTVNSLDYKKALLLFYEQNNLWNFKSMFIQQFEFAVKTYF
jgi:Fic family protein